MPLGWANLGMGPEVLGLQGAVKLLHCPRVGSGKPKGRGLLQM